MSKPKIYKDPLMQTLLRWIIRLLTLRAIWRMLFRRGRRRSGAMRRRR